MHPEGRRREGGMARVVPMPEWLDREDLPDSPCCSKKVMLVGVAALGMLVESGASTLTATAECPGCGKRGRLVAVEKRRQG